MVVDTGTCVRACFGELKIYRDTGKVVASCRRCPAYHVLEDPVCSGRTAMHNVESLVESLVR